jgi:hypothetical protein
LRECGGFRKASNAIEIAIDDQFPEDDFRCAIGSICDSNVPMTLPPAAAARTANPAGLIARACSESRIEIHTLLSNDIGEAARTTFY